MLILLLFAFISGLITILAPCIWPILPIVLSSSATGGKKKPLGITLGVILSFGAFTLTVSYIVKIIPFDPNILRLFAVFVIGFLGLTLIVPRLTLIFESLVSRLGLRFGQKHEELKDQGFKSGFVTGLALGLVWSPCAGPILATIATLSATRSVNIEIFFVTLSYVLGVGMPLFFLTMAGNRIFTRSRFISKYTGRIQQIFGVIMILTAILIYTNYDKVIQVKLLDAFPSYSHFLYKLENSQKVKEQLDILKKKKEEMKEEMKEETANAPEFAGVFKWLNLPVSKKELAISELRGKVVLIDFWTYTCINCIRTLPYVTNWYEKYKDRGFIVVGVHTPEFEFEKKTENVQAAIKQYNITYPVAQDNDYATWNAYDNRYWPAKYLIDKNGNIRYTHFGEGQYEETEKKIRELLEEGGSKIQEEMVKLEEQTPHGKQTPETYLGRARMEKGRVTFDGDWKLEDEYAESLQNSSLTIKFLAKKVFLVITPKKSGDKIKVFLDGKVVDKNFAGADVKDGVVTLDMERLYNLINLPEKGEHILKLEFLDPEIKIYAFTFG